MEKTEGITLQSIPYKERERIVTIFTKENGIISVIVKNLSSKKPKFFSLNSPFCLADFIYKTGRSNIHFLKEVTVLNEHLFLRKDLEFINNAYLMSKAILDSQMPNKKAPALYFLLKGYLKKIPKIKSQKSLLVSFLLKVLLHEGVLNINEKCNLCENKASSIHQGECICPHHSSNYSHNFSLEEFESLKSLAHIKSFLKIEEIKIEETLKEKTLILFKDLI
jgi:DNA repair protein RecO (recombination protein O)